MSRRRGWLIGVTAASLGVVYGYDLSNIAGALLFITDEFGLTTRQQELVTTAVVLGEIAGALGAGLLANLIGRRWSLVLVAAGYAVFALLGAMSESVPVLLVARLLLGLTIGVSVVVVPVFVAESAPARARGSLLVGYQVATVFGIIVGYLACYLLADSRDWRLMLALAAVPATLLALLMLRMPDTARWYLLKGRVADARRALRLVEPDSSDVERELTEISAALKEESGGRLMETVVEMLRRPYLRATVFVIGLGFFIQITGVNAIVYYSPRLFDAMGFRGNFSLLVLPAVVQAAALAAVLISLALVDRLGRRPVLLSGIGAMIAADVVLIVVFAAHSPAIFGFIGVLVFTMGFTFGFGALVWVYAGESFPSRLRSIGSSAMLTANLLANAIVAGGFLTMLHSLGGAGTFGVFGVLAAAGFAFVYRYAPETKGRQLEEIRHFWDNGSHWPDELSSTATDVPACR
jgi:MFS transporter, SP family, galactose:H+ symporter